MKIYISDNQTNYINFIDNAELTSNLKEADLVLFTGGADVDPILYNEDNVYSSSNKQRDLAEGNLFLEALIYNIPCLGICRGAQLMTVLNNGKLIQDVDNHALPNTHVIKNWDKEYNKDYIEITSTHHQMMYPFNLEEDEYKIIASAIPRRSTEYRTGFGYYTEEQVSVEPEIVYYPINNTLAIQGHPEYMDKNSEAVKYCNWLINKYLL